MNTNTTLTITEKLLPILSNHLKFSADDQPFPMDKKLEELGLDSMGAINLFLDLEDSFAITFPPALLTEETFRTATTLSNALSSLINN
ncbi:MAG TPA: acyl carrier protein [Anaerolineae bacterium]|nr:acyl carrier protein [Anaerolineae bacterium]